MLWSARNVHEEGGGDGMGEELYARERERQTATLLGSCEKLIDTWECEPAEQLACDPRTTVKYIAWY